MRRLLQIARYAKEEGSYWARRAGWDLRLGRSSFALRPAPRASFRSEWLSESSRRSQKLGDVLVSSSIIPYDNREVKTHRRWFHHATCTEGYRVDYSDAPGNWHGRRSLSYSDASSIEAVTGSGSMWGRCYPAPPEFAAIDFVMNWSTVCRLEKTRSSEARWRVWGFLQRQPPPPTLFGASSKESRISPTKTAIEILSRIVRSPAETQRSSCFPPW